jgi:hypothetical protein
VASAAVPPAVTSTVLSGGNLILSGSGGASDAGLNYLVLTSTNVAAPLSTWTPVATNTFDGSGSFSATNAVSAGSGQKFFSIKVLP